MSDRRPALLLRAIARLLVRGSEAPYVLNDLRDSFDRDIDAGLPYLRAQRRYAINALASAASVFADRVRSLSLRFSLLDVRLGLRMLWKYPALTLVATFALAVGIPVGLAPMHAVDALQSNLPEDPGGRIRMLRYWDVAHMVPATTTFDDAERWRVSLSSFDTIGAVRMGAYNVEVAATEFQAPGAEVTASTFTMLATPPIRGRVLRTEDETPGGPDVVVIGESLARSLDAPVIDLVGTSVRIGGVPHEVIGVMPEDFRFPSNQQLWLPLRERPAPTPREGRPVTIVGRLAEGVSPDEAGAELSTVHAALAAQRPDLYARLHPEVVHSSFMAFGFPKGGLRALPEFALIQGVTLIPLLIACVNVGLLIFARTATRTSEFAVRTALGASRGRILTQVFTESLVLAVLATGLGLFLLTWLPAQVLTTFKFIPMPYWLTPELSSATLLRALGLACTSAVVAGVVPVLRTTSRSVLQGLQRASSQRSGTQFGWTSSVMIVADVAVAVAAVGFAIGIGHRVAITFANERTDGIQAHRYLSVTMTMAGGEASQARFGASQQALVERLRSEPGVRGVAIATALPRMDHNTRVVEVEGEDALAVNGGGHTVRAASVAPGFFEALRAPILAGRAFDSRDLIAGSQDPASEGRTSTVIVNTMFVEHVLGGRSAIGQRLRYRSGVDAIPGPWHEIVGVVGHLGMHSLTPDQDDGIYLPLVAGSVPRVVLAIETDGEPMALAPRVREIAREVDPRVVLAAPTTLDSVFEGDWYIMTAIVGGVAMLVGVLLALAASGLYAIMSFTIAERTREIGIRMALGADRRSIALQVARRALIQITVGVVIGLPIAASVFFEMQEDSGLAPSAWLAVALALAQGIGIILLVALAACFVPTRRALRISPVEALRGDG
jgi:putative ABC transport system permease protein